MSLGDIVYALLLAAVLAYLAGIVAINLIADRKSEP